MKFDLVSDLHVDINEEELQWEPQSSVLIIAGDSANDPVGSLMVAKTMQEGYKHVLILDGNHEHYNGQPIDQNIEVMKMHTEAWGINFLSPDKPCSIDGVMFIGANGWYDFNMASPLGYSKAEQVAEWRSYSNDAKLIKFNGTVSNLAQNQFIQLRNAINSIKQPIVVVTHTSPLLRGLLIKNIKIWDMLSGAYGNTYMENIINKDQGKKIKCWCFGHTHHPSDFVEQNIRFVANPRGYGVKHSDRFWHGPVQIDTDV